MSNFFTDMAKEIKKEWNEFKDDFQDYGQSETFYENEGEYLDPDTQKRLNPDFVQLDGVVRTPAYNAETNTADNNATITEEAISMDAIVPDASLKAPADNNGTETTTQEIAIEVMPECTDGECGLQDHQLLQELNTIDNVYQANDIYSASAADTGAEEALAKEIAPNTADVTLNTYYVEQQTQLGQAIDNVHNQADALHDTFEDQGTQTVQAMSDIANDASAQIDAIRGKALRDMAQIRNKAADTADTQKRMAASMQDAAYDAGEQALQTNPAEIEIVTAAITDQKQNILNAADAVEDNGMQNANDIRNAADATYASQSERLNADMNRALQHAADKADKAKADADDIRIKAAAKEQQTIDALNKQIQEAKDLAADEMSYATTLENEGLAAADACRSEAETQYAAAADAADKRKNLAYVGADNREAQGKARAEALRKEADACEVQLQTRQEEIQASLADNKEALQAESAKARETLEKQADALASQADMLYDKMASKI